MREVSTDIAVIGAGPSGAVLALRLAAAGRQVTLIERGEWLQADAIDRTAPDYDLLRRGPFSANPNHRRGPADDPVDDADSPIKPMIGNAVGGGALWWSAHVPRFRPEDFRTHSLDGVGQDWPLSYDDLAPFYAEVEAIWGVASVPGDPSAVPDRPAPNAPFPSIGGHGARVTAALDRIGWHWWPVDLVRGHDADETPCDHIGPCDIGCPGRRRSNADRIVTEAIAAGADLMESTRVLRLELGEGDRIASAHCRQGDTDIRLRANTFVLAANGMGTPRLLLLSACERYPDGLANRSGLVGRNLMLHPYARVDGLFDDPLGGWAPHEIAGIVCLEFLAAPDDWGAKRGVKLQLTAGPGATALARGAATGAPPPWGAGHHAAFEALFDRTCGFTVCAEDLADPDNRIALSPHLTDRDGNPAAKMVYRVSDNSRRLLDHGLARAEEVLREAGATSVHHTPLRDQAGFHIMGTARMGTDPDASVTDPWGRCHDLENLFIADASTFVTASCLNPTATAQALALRTAEHILGHAVGP